jgi:uncharacterized protein (TIGR00251 family)
VAFARDVDGGARLVISAKPKSSKEGVSVKDGVVVVRVSAPPEDGKANARVVEVVAAFVGIPRSRVSIVRGETARQKELFLAGVAVAAVDEALAKG